MSDKYYRGLRNILNDTKHKLQLASMTLKINENKNSISEIKNDISEINNFSDKINTNTSDILTNLGKINEINNNLVNFTTNYSIENIFSHNITLEKEYTLNSDNLEHHIFTYNIEDDFRIDSYLEVNSNILYDYRTYSNIGRLSQMFRFYDEKNTLLDEIKLAKTNAGDSLYENLDAKNMFYIKINHNCSTISIKLSIGFLHETSNNIIVKIINPLKSNKLWVKYYKKIKKLSIDNDLSDLDSNILSNKSLIETNTSNISDNSGLISTNTLDISNNSGLISTNTLSIASNSELISTNTSDISDNSELISTNTSDISDNKGLISTNTSSIASNLLKINKNTDDITALQNSNIKAFYNLDQIFIYDIKNGYKTVDKDNHYHIFEKEITYNYIKNSYLEIALKVLTEISNYVLIGFFQILCNFYDQDNNLFYTISLSTAMGSINKLSTIKSVFIVPINENMSKIKIDFFIAPKETQQNRSAKFTIQDINSNKIYIKYFQKTEEMSIKDIQDSLDNVKNISNQIDENKNDIINLKNDIKLKNIYNVLFYEERKQISFKNNFFDNTYDINIKKDDFIEIDLRMLLDYGNINESHITITEFRLYNDNDEQIYTNTYNNGNHISFNNFVFINKNIFYNFEKDTTKLRILIFFRMTKVEVVKIWYEPKNTDRFILKHYGN